MSLETQITALVNAANKLTSEVANKMKGIDSTLTAAQKKFDEFTGKDFPERVSEARQITLYVDPQNGNDGNTGLSALRAVQTWSKARDITGGSDSVYDRVVIYVRAGTVLPLTTAVHALEELTLRPYGDAASPGAATKLVQESYGSGTAKGRPIQPFRAPFVYINQMGDADFELHTAEFKDGHEWPEVVEGNRDADWMCYAGSMLSNISRFKLRNVKVKLHDMPLSTVYMSGSLGNFASYEIVLGARCEISGEAPGAASGTFTHKPKLLHVYANSRVPLDIVADRLELAGSLKTAADLFDNLSLENVRSSFPI